MPPYALAEPQYESTSEQWMQFYVNGGIDFVDPDTGEITTLAQNLGMVGIEAGRLGCLAFNHNLPDAVREFFYHEFSVKQKEIGGSVPQGYCLVDYGDECALRNSFAFRAMFLFLKAGMVENRSEIKLGDADFLKRAVEIALNMYESLSSGDIILNEKMVNAYNLGWVGFRDQLLASFQSVMSDRLCLNPEGRAFGHARRLFDLLAGTCNCDFKKASPKMIAECTALYMERAFDLYERLYVQNHSGQSK